MCEHLFFQMKSEMDKETNEEMKIIQEKNKDMKRAKSIYIKLVKMQTEFANLKIKFRR